MVILPALAAVLASLGWATGIVLAHNPARQMGAFEFTRVQLIACSAIMAIICTALGLWSTLAVAQWPAFAISIGFGIVIGNLAMIECLRQGGPRRTELLLALKAPVVAAMAYVWLGETLSLVTILGIGVVISGICLAVQSGDSEIYEPKLKSKRLFTVISLGILATASQGLGFLVVKPAMTAGAEPIAVSAARLLGAAFLISSVAIFPLKSFASKTEMTMPLLGQTVLPGFIGYGVSSSLLLYAFANFDAGVAAVLGSLSPVLVLPIIWWRDGQKPGLRGVCGAFLAVLGTAVVVYG